MMKLWPMLLLLISTASANPIPDTDANAVDVDEVEDEVREPPPQLVEGQTPEEFCVGKDDGNYPAGDCEDHFIQCFGKGVISHVQPCGAASLRYNWEVNACVGSSAVPGCRKPMEPKHPCDDRPNGFFPDPLGACNKYSFCVEGIFYSVNCDPGLVFDAGMNRCGKPENVPAPCGTFRPEVFECVKDGLYRSAMDCAIWYECLDGIVTAARCPFLQAFDISKGTCESFWDVTECAPDQNQHLGEQVCEILGFDDILQHPEDCTRSMVCLQGKAFVFICAEEDRPHFDPELKTCVENVPDCDRLPDIVG